MRAPCDRRWAHNIDQGRSFTSSTEIGPTTALPISSPAPAKGPTCSFANTSGGSSRTTSTSIHLVTLSRPMGRVSARRCHGSSLGRVVDNERAILAGINPVLSTPGRPAASGRGQPLTPSGSSRPRMPPEPPGTPSCTGAASGRISAGHGFCCDRSWQGRMPDPARVMGLARSLAPTSRAHDAHLPQGAMYLARWARAAERAVEAGGPSPGPTSPSPARARRGPTGLPPRTRRRVSSDGHSESRPPRGRPPD